MIEIEHGRGVTPQHARAASAWSAEVAGRLLTQRRVIDLKRHVADCCPLLLTQ